MQGNSCCVMGTKRILITASLLLFSITALGQETPLKSKEPLEGYADIHVHQMGNLGFGGSIIWGAAWGPPSEALGKIPKNMRRGHTITEGATHGKWAIPKTVINSFIWDFFRHGEEGYPSFSSWPNTNIWTHQQVYEDWLFRAYQGGLRLMVMLAVNSEDMFGRGENQIPLIGSHAFQKVRAEGRTGNDMEALEWQVRAAYQFQAHIDEEYGPGKGWYRIVRDPQEASEVIKSGRLAVILGTELQHLFNCDKDRPDCNAETIIEGLNRLEAMGVNYVFPIHHKLNQFGGPAMFTPANSGDMDMNSCPPGYTHKCSIDGLTDLGRTLVKELTARGMLIDTEHLSLRSFNDTMAIAEERKYPVLASHIVPFDLVEGDELTERAKTKTQIRRILDVGGIVAPLLGTSAQQYQQSKPAIPILCRPAYGGSTDQWANAYLFMRDLAGGGVTGPSGRIAMGSDWNGFAGWPGPRDSCDKKHQVTYPITLPDQLVPAAIRPTTTLPMFEFPDKKLWDYNKTGVAHVGMLPDFFQNVRLLGLDLADLEPMYRSARGVVNLWQTARNIVVTGDRHHLRWAPQSPFDVLKFEYWDSSRDISARAGFPICRSRSVHLLGFEKDGKCILVETQSSTVQFPEKISAYHNGRCLDIADASKEGGKVIQNRCGDSSSQRWQVRNVGGTRVELVNNRSGKCLTSSGSKGARAIQQTCSGKDDQIWDAQRSGNTFSLMLAKHVGNLCLGVRDQSREDGAAIQQEKCTAASNQKWSIESLRKDDFEKLYQADKKQFPKLELNVFDWLDSDTADYPIPVTVDDSRQICKSTDGQNWIGVVTGGECVGKTYDGAPVTTARFKKLYQAN